MQARWNTQARVGNEIAQISSPFAPMTSAATSAVSRLLSWTYKHQIPMWPCHLILGCPCCRCVGRLHHVGASGQKSSFGSLLSYFWRCVMSVSVTQYRLLDLGHARMRSCLRQCEQPHGDHQPSHGVQRCSQMDKTSSPLLQPHVDCLIRWHMAFVLD